MTNPDFAELKKEFSKFDEQGLFAFSGQENKGTWTWQMMLDGAQYQHSKSAAIITELLEIIQSQSEALESCGCFCGSFDFDKLACISCSALSETNTRLQKLREDK